MGRVLWFCTFPQLDMSMHPTKNARFQRKPTLSVLLAGLALLAVACEQPELGEATAEAANQPRVVEIIATYDPETNEHLFELSHDEIPYGWTTFRLVNASPDEHLAQIFKVPEDAGVTPEVWIRDLIEPIQRSVHRFHEPDMESFAEASEGMELPDWWRRASPRGGPGLVRPGATSEAMAMLEPGHYIIECYVKDADEVMHTTSGMAALLIVTDEPSGASEPEADIELTLSKDGIQGVGDLEAGKQTVRVSFEDRRDPDLRIETIHLARLDEEVRLEDLSNWMAWMVAGSYVAPAPAEFVGGTGRKPVGHATYFTVDLEPGDYAWVAEYGTNTEAEPHLEELGWLKTFTVKP